MTEAQRAALEMGVAMARANGSHLVTISATLIELLLEEDAMRAKTNSKPKESEA